MAEVTVGDLMTGKELYEMRRPGGDKWEDLPEDVRRGWEQFVTQPGVPGLARASQALERKSG